MRFALFLILMVSPSLASATGRIYRDLKATSANGRYEATAVSPDNEAKNQEPPAFQDDFTVSVRDLRSGNTLWSYRQGKDEASPTELILTDGGELILRNGWDEYYVFNKNGTPMKVFSPNDDIPKREMVKFADETSAGVSWLQYSQQGFFENAGKTYFYVRTYWGRIIAIDPQACVCVPTGSVLESIENEIVRRTESLIADAEGKLVARCERCGEEHLRDDIAATVFVAKLHGLPGKDRFIERVLAQDGELATYLNRVTTKDALPDSALVAGMVCAIAVLAVVVVAMRRSKGKTGDNKT
jgi:hypothetical protein